MKEKGFSLIELVVVLAISAIFVTMAFPVFTDYMGKDRAKRAARSVIGSLNGARLNALKTGKHTVAAFDTDSISVVEVGGNVIFTVDLPKDCKIIYDTLPGGIVRYAVTGALEDEYVKTIPKNGELYPLRITTGNKYLQFEIGVSISGLAKII